jgi:transposase
MNWRWLSLSIVRVGSFASISACQRHVQLRVISEVQVGQFCKLKVSVLDVIHATKRKPRIMRYELTDFEWAVIRSLLPNKPRGIPRVDDRRVLNGIFWVLRSDTGEAKTSQLAGWRAPKDHVQLNQLATALRCRWSDRCWESLARRPASASPGLAPNGRYRNPGRAGMRR